LEGVSVPDVGKWWRQLVAGTEDRDTAIQTAWQQIDDLGLVSKVTVHRYICAKCNSPLVTVIRLGNNTIAHVRDYKLSPGMNRDRSVEEARKRNTLDGKRHWPAHAYDVNALAAAGPHAGFDVVCRGIWRQPCERSTSWRSPARYSLDGPVHLPACDVGMR
jgi:hypothetical protein